MNAFSRFTSYCWAQAVLKECAKDNVKLAHTGEPIVKWPERVSRELISSQMFVYEVEECQIF